MGMSEPNMSFVPKNNRKSTKKIRYPIICIGKIALFCTYKVFCAETDGLLHKFEQKD